jgi:hypothetical protein
MVDVADRPDIYMRFLALKFLFCHVFSSSALISQGLRLTSQPNNV